MTVLESFKSSELGFDGKTYIKSYYLLDAEGCFHHNIKFKVYF